MAPETPSAEPLPLLELVSRGGVGRLYTLNEAEARAAVRDHGMTREPGQIGYIPPRRTEGTTPLYRLKPTRDSNRWLVTPSSHERDTLAGRQWVYEGVVGYVYTDAGAGREKVNRYTNGREWRLALESESQALLGAGYRLDGPVGWVNVDANP